jgi:ketosteroid isomerase-like protein
MRLQDLAAKWVDAFNRGDADEITELYAENAVNHQFVRETVREIAIPEIFVRDFGSPK